MQQLKDVPERSAKTIAVAFYDESGSPITPTSATWTLTDGLGQLVNSRENVTIDSLSSSVNITPSGDDHIARTTRDENMRCLVIKSIYTSSRTGLPTANNQGVKYLVVDLPQT